MKLYRAKIPEIAKEIIDALVDAEDIEVPFERREEAEMDLAAIMGEYVRRDMDLREHVREHMAEHKIAYSDYGRTRKRIADQTGHPIGDDVERFLARQFVENMMISPNVEEVFSDDPSIHRKMLDILRSHHVNEAEIHEEAVSKIKNVREGTVDYEIALQNAVRAEKKRRGLI